MGESVFATKPPIGPVQDSVVEPARTPLPRPKPAPTHEIDPAHLTAADLIDPHTSPSLEHVGPDAILRTIEKAVPMIFNTFRESVETVARRLVAPPPPKDESIAVEIMSMFVEIAADAALGMVGERVAHGVKHAFGELAGTATADAMKAAAKAEGVAAGNWFKSHAESETRTDDGAPDRAATSGATLIEDFAKREKNAINAKELASDSAIEVLRAALPRINTGDLSRLEKDVHALASDNALSAWFERKLAMEWQNFRARLSLEEHQEDLGTNSITTGVNANAALRRLDGFVDITIDADDLIHGVEGLSVAKVNVDLPGAAKVLKSSERTLANVPMYRRVWVTSGSSKISAEPVMLVAPDGEIQADLKSPILAAIGADISTSFVDATTKESSRDFAAAVVNAASAAQGARAIMALLAKKHLEFAE